MNSYIKSFFLCLATSLCYVNQTKALDDFFCEDGFFQVSPEDAGSQFQPPAAPSATPINTLDILQNLNILEVAKIGLYRTTAFTSKRDVEDLPALFATTPLASSWQLNTFFNYTPKLFFSKNGDSIDDLSSLSEFADFIRGLDQSLLPSNDIPQYLGLLTDGFAEERRVGFLFQYFYRTQKDFIFGLRVPLYYLERNWNLDAGAQKQLKELASNAAGDASPSAQSEYYPLVVNDALGLGDIRLIFGGLVYDSDKYKTCAGVDLTVPTGWAFHRGLIGSNMPKSYIPQRLDLQEIVSSVIPDVNQEYLTAVAQDFGQNAIKQLGAIGLAAYMGMEKDTGLGLFIDEHIEAWRGVRFFGRIRAAAYIPPTKTWHFNLVKNPADFNPEDYEFTDTPENQLKAEKQIQFLQNQLLANYFPLQYNTKFKTRSMLHALGGINFDVANNWEFFVGYDYWRLSGDRVKEFCQGDQQNTCPLNIEQACRPTTSQQKLFGGLTFTSFRHWYDVEASFTFDQTIASRSIGRDTTLNVQVAWFY